MLFFFISYPRSTRDNHIIPLAHIIFRVIKSSQTDLTNLQDNIILERDDGCLAALTICFRIERKS